MTTSIKGVKKKNWFKVCVLRTKSDGGKVLFFVMWVF